MTTTSGASKKQAAKKAAPVTAAERVEAFDSFRQRAASYHLTTEDSVQRPPYVLGKDRGFDPPIAIAFPKKLQGQIRLDQAVRNQDYFGALSVLTGNNLMRIAAEFEKYDDAMRLMIGLMLEIIDHFVGPGASDVEGGSAAS